jgi:hypothetical protein
VLAAMSCQMPRGLTTGSPPCLCWSGPLPLLQRRGKKALVLDPAVSGPLSLLDTGLADLLTEHGVVK